MESQEKDPEPTECQAHLAAVKLIPFRWLSIPVQAKRLSLAAWLDRTGRRGFPAREMHAKRNLMRDPGADID